MNLYQARNLLGPIRTYLHTGGTLGLDQPELGWCLDGRQAEHKVIIRAGEELHADLWEYEVLDDEPRRQRRAMINATPLRA